MKEEEVIAKIEYQPFMPLRLHLLNGKAVDVLRPETVKPLRDRLLLFTGMAADHRSAQSYDIISYQQIDWIEQFNIGNRPAGTRRYRS